MVVISLYVRCPAKRAKMVVSASKAKGERETRELERKERTDRVSQIFREPSSEPVTIHLPSQWKAREVMLAVWPSKVAICAEAKEGRGSKLYQGATGHRRAGRSVNERG